MFSFDRKYLLAAVICGGSCCDFVFLLQQLERKVLQAPATQRL